MADEEEFRKVAEDVRALARSLAKDFREAAARSRQAGQPLPRAFRHGIRDVAEEAKRGARSGWDDFHSHHRHKRDYQNRRWWDSPFPPYPGGPSTGPEARPGSTPYYRDGRPPRPGRPSRDRHARRRRGPLPPVRRRWDSTTVIGLLAVLFGVAWLLGGTGLVHVSVEAVVAVGLMLLGASLILTGRTDWSLSRHAWPVWLGVGLIAVLLATSATFGVGAAFSSVSFGRMSAAPTGSSTVHGGFGTLTVDATRLHGGQVLQIDSVAGSTVVQLPAGVAVDVDARVLAGQICIDGDSVAAGVGASTDRQIGDSDGRPVEIDVHQVAGQILIGGSQCRSQ